METVVSGFDWDEGNRAKCQKHGVSIPEIEALFAGELAVFPALSRSWHEERLKAIGKTRAGRHVFVVFTLRKRSTGVLIRPISARYMHKQEVDHYEKEVAKAEKR
ncbi:MAG: BrnT family toxin [Alphaproteobacteria bacterium]